MELTRLLYFGMYFFILFIVLIPVLYNTQGGAFQGIIKIALIIFFIITGSALTYKGINHYMKFKKVEFLPTSTIRSVAIGLSEVKGKIMLHKKLISPVTQKECAGYKINYTVIRRRPGFWSSVVKYFGNDSKITDFYIKDETGKLLVKGSNEFTLKREFNENKWKVLYDNYKPNTIKINEQEVVFEGLRLTIENGKDIKKETLDELLTLPDFSSKYVPVNNKIFVWEDCLEEGMDVYILGTVELSENGEKVLVKGKDNLFEINNDKELNVVKNLRNLYILNLLIGLIFLGISVFLVASSI